MSAVGALPVTEEEKMGPTPVVRRPLLLRIMGGLRKMITNVTLEPMLFLKMMAESNIRVVADTLEIDRVCRINLGFPSDDCAAMDDGNHSDVQSAVQKYQNTFNYYQNLIDSLLPLLVILLAGSLSDRYGRKVPMAIVLVGFIAFALVYIVTAANPSWPVEVLYAATVAVDVTGTWVVFNMAVYSYISDLTPEDTRTKRMGLLDAVWYLGGPIGTLLGGWLYGTFGYIAVFAASAVMWLACFLYVVVFVKESVTSTSRDVDDSGVTEPTGPSRHIISSFRTAIRPRPFNGRVHLLILLSIKLGIFLVQGHQVYLWARRVMGWGATDFSTWSGLDEAIHQFGMVLWVLVAANYGLHDTTVALAGIVSIMLWSVTLACIVDDGTWWLVIVASVLGMLEASIEPALRTLITSLSIGQEAGRLLALLGLLEAVWLTVDRSLFTFLYNTFVDDFPQINFVVQAVVALLLAASLLSLKKSWEKERHRNPIPSDDHQHCN